MKVEIWSDVMCPFCYIGKRRFEAALAQFDDAANVEINWKSFQLNPTLKTDPSISIHQYLANAKGWDLEYAQQVNQQVTEMAEGEGLTYNFDRAIVANSFNAHRLIQLAKQHGLGGAAEEALFKAYFTEGKNIDDYETLINIGTAIGLPAEEIKQMLDTNSFADAINADINEAQALGIRGVPFFVIDRKYAVSGAQPTEVFLQALSRRD